MFEEKFLKFPAPYFGGKSAVADTVWRGLGGVRHYIEPFAGSCAVLLARPDWGPGAVETVNDKNGFIANVWRALQFSPDEVARWCDWPVNHADLAARKAALIKNEERLLENLVKDEKWHDPVLAGYWIWAASCWIGSGLTEGRSDKRERAVGQAGGGRGVYTAGKRPHIGQGGVGVHAIGQRPHLTDSGVGVHAIGQRPDISHSGKGVHAVGQIPHLTDGGVGVHAIGRRPDIVGDENDVRAPYNVNLYRWFRVLSERMRYVRVVCGDWKRVCGGNWQDKVGLCGMFFDPPYGVKDRDGEIYGKYDGADIAAEVLDWVRERGKRKTYRIVVAGYEEYEPLLDDGWRVYQWKAQGGYGHLGNGPGKQNRHRERLYFSPYCLPLDVQLEIWHEKEKEHSGIA